MLSLVTIWVLEFWPHFNFEFCHILSFLVKKDFVKKKVFSEKESFFLVEKSFFLR